MSSVVMIGGGIQEVEAVKVAQSRGLRVIVTDRKPDAPCFDVADTCVVLDGRDVESLAAYTILNKKKADIRGVFTLTELITSVAVVAEAADLPGVPISPAVACQNKALSKRLWLDKGIATPQASIVDSKAEATKAFENLGRKAFVKANTGFGGQGCRKVETVEELCEAFENARNASMDGNVLIEKFLKGSMHDVNAIFDVDGKLHEAGIADRFFHKEHPIEVEARCPSHLSETQKQDLLSLVEEAAKALGIMFGPVKADAVLTSEGFKILEMAPRLHGPRGTLWLLPFALGFRPLEAALQVLTGKYLSPQCLKPKFERACIYRAIMPSPGRVVSISGMEEALKLTGIEKILLFVQEGMIIPDYENSTHVPCYVYATGDNFQLAERRLEEATQMIRIATATNRIDY